MNNYGTPDASSAVWKCLHISCVCNNRNSRVMLCASLSVCHLFHHSTEIQLKEKSGILFSYFLASIVLKSY